MYELLEAQARRRPSAVAIEAPGRGRLTYGELREVALALAAEVRRRGLPSTGRIGLVLPNGPDMAVALLGATCCAVAAPLNPACTEQEFASYMSQLKLDAVWAGRGHATAAPAAATSLGIPVWELELGFPAGPRWPHVRATTDVLLADPSGPEAKALVLLTSGSTGRPKRVPLTHANVFASIPEINASLDLGEHDRCLSMWEQFHVGGLVDLLLAPLAAGGTVICGSRFDVGVFFERLADTQPTWFQAVPATLHEILAYARKQGWTRVSSSLRLIRSVAAALPPQTMAEVEQLFGVPVLQTFGMTEASPLITSTALPPVVRKPGSVGRSYGTQVAIMDDAGRRLPRGQVGQVVVQGRNVMNGYEEDEEANQAIFRHGWFHTGDVGYLDEEGDLFLKGRVREMINRGGEKICPQEIDDVLATHPAVAQAVAFAVPHKVLGEDVAVAVVLRPDREPVSAPEIRAYVAARLSAFKVPQQVVVVDRLPRGATGKVKRLELATLLPLPAAAPYVAPETPLEQQVAGVWAAELNLPRIGLDDQFAQLGGDSLSGVRLVTALEKELGRALPPAALVQLSTVRDMVAILVGSSAPSGLHARPVAGQAVLPESDYRVMLSVLGSSGIPAARPGSLVLALNGQGSKPPLFWCFNSPGKEMPRLARKLGDEQPLYGLYSGGGQFKDEEVINARVADHYVEELLALRPEGPFLLGGNCRGAGIAGRVAQRLIDRGRTVEALCSLDYFDARFFAFPGRLLLLFGRQSHFRAHRKFRWGRPGWRSPFRSPPRVAWVEGEHARFFEEAAIDGLIRELVPFLAGSGRRDGLGETVRSALLRLVHANIHVFTRYVRVVRWWKSAGVEGGGDEV